MKICWDNLEGLYLTKHGNFRKGNNTYIEKDCKSCAMPFLAKKYGKEKTINYCTQSCGAKSNNHKSPITNINKGRKKKRICREYRYYDNPKFCSLCGNILTYEQSVLRNCKCCSFGCSGILKGKDPIIKYKRRQTWAKKINYDIKKWKDYNQLVRKYTNRNYKKFKDKINPDNLPRGKRQYSLDHKFSIHDGFVYNVDPKIIAHPYNLQMITEQDNLAKSFNSSISIEELNRRVP